MYKVILWKCGEVLIESIDEDEGDIWEAFFDIHGGRDAYLELDDERIDDLLDVKKLDEPVMVTKIPEGYKAHILTWRFTEYEVKLKDEDYALTADDFSYRVIHLGDWAFHQLVLDENVGELEFIYSSDGICDEDIDD